MCCVTLTRHVNLQRTTKGPKAIERLRKKLSEQESLLLLMSPNMAFRVANRNGKVSLQREAVKFTVFTDGWSLCRCCPLLVTAGTAARSSSSCVSLTLFRVSRSSSRPTMNALSGGRSSASSRRNVSFFIFELKCPSLYYNMTYSSHINKERVEQHWSRDYYWRSATPEIKSGEQTHLTMKPLVNQLSNNFWAPGNGVTLHKMSVIPKQQMLYFCEPS